MNCKPGELAVVTRPFLGTCLYTGAKGFIDCTGQIVTCVRVSDAGIWEVDPPLHFEDVELGTRRISGTIGGTHDKYLRPLRGGPGDDETLTWDRHPVPAHA